MDTNERIKKLKLGGTSSRDDYRNAEATYQQAVDILNNSDLSDEEKENRKREALAYIQSYENQSSGDPHTNYYRRRGGAEAYRIATDMIKGTFDPAKVKRNTGSNYGSQAAYGEAGDIANAFYDLNREVNTSKPQAAEEEVPAASASPSLKNWNWSWNNGLSNGIPKVGATRGKLVQAYASGLLNNLLSAKAKEDEGGWHLRGKVDGMYDDIETLQALIKNGDFDSDNTYNALVDVANRYDPSGSHWRAYFGKFLPGESAKEKADAAKQAKIDALEEEGYHLQGDDFDAGSSALSDYARQNGLRFALDDDNNMYLVKKDLSGVVDQDFTDINQDYNDQENYGRGFHINGATGRVFRGDLLNLDESNPYAEAINQYIGNINDGSSLAGRNYNRYLTSSNNFNYATDFANDETGVLEHFGSSLSGKRVTDVSSYFDGNDQIIATFEDNNPANHIDRLGNLKFDKGVHLYRKNANGEYDHFTGDQLANKGLSQNFRSKKAAGNAHDFEYNNDFFENDLLELSDDDLDKDLNNQTDAHNFWRWHSDARNLWTDEKIDTHAGVRSGGNTDDRTARMFLTYLANPDAVKYQDEDGKDYTKNFITANPAIVARVVYDYLKEDPNRLVADFGEEHAAEIMRAWRLFVNSKLNKFKKASDGRTAVPAQKEGGIVKAAEGVVVDRWGRPGTSAAKSARDKMSEAYFADQNSLERRAEQNNYSINKQSAIDKGWSSQDSMRAAALASDIVGLVGAATGAATAGIGSGVAIGTGILSTALDTAADFSDDKVGARQAWTNLGLNLGLTAGAAFGAKAPRVIQRTMKIVPKALMALGTAGVALDPEIQNSVGRLASGKSLNANDWKNITMVLRMATGLGTVGAMKAGTNRQIKKFDARMEAELKKVGASPELKVAIKNGANEQMISKKDFDDISRRLAAKDEAGAIAKLKSIKELNITTDDEARAFLNTEKVANRVWNKPKTWFNKEEVKSLNAVNPEGKPVSSVSAELQAKIYEQLLAESRANTNSSGRLMGRNWFTKAMSWGDAASEKLTFGLAKQQNYALNNLLNHGNFANEAELVNWIKENRALFGNTDLADVDTTAYRRALEKAAPELEALRQAEANLQASKDEVASLNREVNELDLPGSQKKLDEAKAALDAANAAVNEKHAELQRKLAAVQDASMDPLIAKNLSSYESASQELRAAREEEAAAKKALAEYIAANPGHVNEDGQLTAWALKRYRKAAQLMEAVQAATQKVETAAKSFEGVVTPTKTMKGANTELAAARTELETARNNAGIPAMEQELAALRKSRKKGRAERIKKAEDALEKAIKDNNIEALKAKVENLENKYANLRGKRVRTVLDKHDQFRTLDDESRALKSERSALIKERNAAHDNVRKLQKEHAALEERSRQLKEDIDNKQAATTSLEEEVTRRRQINETAQTNARKAAVQGQAQNIGTTSRETSFKAADGTETKLPAGAKVTSFMHLRKNSAAPEASANTIKKIKELYPDAKDIPLQEVLKYVPINLRTKVKGGLYSPTGGIILYNEGGILNTTSNKYSHLRK